MAVGLEPAFSRGHAAWPLAGIGALPTEPGDPDVAFPRGALHFSFRDMPERHAITDIGPELTATAELPDSAGPAERRRGWTAAILASCLLHAAVAAVLLMTPGGTFDPDAITQIEGSSQSGVMMVGNAADDQSAAGARDDPDVTRVTLVPMVEPRPVETVAARPVTAAETLQPVEDAAPETPVTETLEPVREAPAPQRVEPQRQGPARTATLDPLPEVLSAETIRPDDEDAIPKSAVPVPTARPTEAARTAPVETTDTVAAEDVPAPKPAEKAPATRPAEEKKPVEAAEKQPPMKAAAKPSRKPAKPPRQKARAGSGGQGEADARRGAANGRESSAALASRGGRKSGTGNAAVSNYPGKVAARLQRVARGISRSAQAKARNNAQVAFVVSADGGVAATRLVKSSGSPDLDRAALAIIRRAAPFPPIPPDAGRSKWAFTLPIGPF